MIIKKHEIQTDDCISLCSVIFNRRSKCSLKIRKFGRDENYFWGGISYRFLNDQFFKPLNIGPMVGFKQAVFYFGYAYQFTTNGLSAYNSGTHVVTIGLDFLRGISNCACTKSRVKY